MLSPGRVGEGTKKKELLLLQLFKSTIQRMRWHLISGMEVEIMEITR